MNGESSSLTAAPHVNPFTVHHSPFTLLAALTAAPEKIPDLKPIRGAIPPSFWEAYGWLVLLLLGVACLAIALLMNRLRRPKPVIIPSAADLARRELERVRASSDETALPAAVARVLRHFLVKRFRLAGPGMTAHEIAAHLPIEPALVAELQLFLDHCDLASFAPAAARSLPAATIGEAERLIGAVERQSPPPLPQLAAR